MFYVHLKKYETFHVLLLGTLHLCPQTACLTSCQNHYFVLGKVSWEDQENLFVICMHKIAHIIENVANL